MADTAESSRPGGQAKFSLDDLQPTFFVDDQPGKYWDVGDNFVYDRHVQVILGDQSADDEDDGDVRRCFNCGSPSHAVSSCPEPYNSQLVSLSRQLFDFFKRDSIGGSMRIHEVAEWKRQRKDWLETFEPGQIRGPLLREALGLEEGDAGDYVEWLQNMALWGYPKGWVGHTDPRFRVWQAIVERADGSMSDLEDGPALFSIYGEQEIPEELLLPVLHTSAVEGVQHGENHATEGLAEGSASSTSSPKRWAQYPETYFSSSRLPIYNGFSLPPVNEAAPEQSSTFSVERQALWRTIINDHANIIQPEGVSQPYPLLPPPPPGSPPPLPPEPSEMKAAAPVLFKIDDPLDGDSEVDMVLSDSE